MTSKVASLGMLMPKCEAQWKWCFVCFAKRAAPTLESRDQSILRQWQMRLERAEYEAALAERRYQEVDPANRLVAGTLERRWNDALVHF